MFLFLLCFAALQLNWFPQIVSSRSENRKQEVPVAMARCECYVLTNTAQWHLAGNAVAVWTAFECADARVCMRASESVHVFLPPWSSRRRMAVFAKWTQIRFQLVLLWHFQQPCRPLHHQIPSLLLIKHSCALKTVSKIRQMSTSLAWPSISFMPNQQCGHMPLLNSQLRTAFRNITAADWSGSGDCSWGFQGSNDGWSVGPGSLSGALSSLSLEVTHGRGLFNSHLLFVIKASKWWDEGQNKVCAM